MKKAKTSLTIALGYFNAKDVEKQMGSASLRNFRTDNQNRQDHILAVIAERKDLLVTNTLFYKRKNSKRIQKRPFYNQKKIDVTLSDKPVIVQNVDVLSKIFNSGH